jgi:hypothetical protein
LSINTYFYPNNTKLYFKKYSLTNKIGLVFMKKFYPIVLLACLFNACQRDAQKNEVNVQPQVVSVTKIDEFIKETGYDKFRWSMATDEMVWSAAQQTDKIVSIGYKPLNETNAVEDRLHEVNIQDATWAGAKKQVMDIIFEEEIKVTPSVSRDKMEEFENKILPVVDVKINSFKTIQRLRASGYVRYVEPMAYEPTNTGLQPRSDSGCDGNGADATLTTADYTVLSPNAKASWNHSFHQIQQAWTKSTGAGAKVMIIDSGVSAGQENLGSQINQGSSTGRTVEQTFTLGSANDLCGHGTSMAGLCAAPRGTDGNAAGVAYNCNLVTCRASNDVYLNESAEIAAVANAYTFLGNRADVKISSMSMGKVLSNSQISDAIKYAYGKGKLMFCAAGTSFDWTSWWGVIFPANMTEVQAVTGVKDYATTNTTCDVCHDGSAVDFIIVMEKASNGKHPLTTANSGDAPSTVGGSSCATATCAGIAALVASKFPTYTRDQITSKMAQSSSYYPSKNGYYGWGRVNANAAVQ